MPTNAPQRQTPGTIACRSVDKAGSASSSPAGRCFLTPGPTHRALDLELPPGTVLDRFVVKEHLAHGGAGVIVRARDEIRDTDVALKIVDADTSSEASSALALRQEAVYYARVQDHRHVIRGHDLHSLTLNGRPLLILSMEYADGGTFTGWLHAQGLGRATLRSAVELFLGACRGVRALHGVCLLHADLHPDNLVLAAGTLKVVDLGSAVLVNKGPVSWHADAVGMSVADDIRALGSILAMVVAYATGRTQDGRLPLDEYLASPLWQGTDLAGLIARCMTRQGAGCYSAVDELIADVAAYLGVAPNDDDGHRPTDIVEVTRALWSAACGHVLKGDLSHAERTCARLLAVCPDHADGIALLGRLQDRSRQVADLNGAATISLERGDLRESIRLLKASANLYPRHPETAALGVRVRSRARDYVQLIAEGERERAAGNLVAAITCYTRAQEVNRSDGRISQTVSDLRARLAQGGDSRGLNAFCRATMRMGRHRPDQGNRASDNLETWRAS